MRDKLTPLALRRAWGRVASGYIIKAKTGYFRELVETAREYELAGLVRRYRPLMDLLREVTPLGPLGLGLRELPRFNMIAGIFSREVIFDMAEWRAVERIFSDEVKWALYNVPYTVPPEGIYQAERKVKKPITFTTTYWTKRMIGANIANQKGFDGSGILVAICDTGARRTHEQIRGRVATETSLKGQYTDFNGHGTWCTTCIGGKRAVDERLSRIAGRPVYVEGIAPGVDLLAVKCLGYGVGMGSDSSIIEAVQIALDYGADVINLSLGGPVEVENPEDDPHYWVFEEVRRSGAIACVAAGNEGPGKGTISSPGWLPNVLTVGAWDPITGKLAEFSSRGPTPDGRDGVDCVAPGVNVDSGIAGQLDYAGDNMENRYSPISGTSMATPHVSGLVALMREAVALRSPWMRFDLDMAFDMLKETAVEPKNPETGWGLITWKRFEEYMETEHGVRI